VTRDLDLLLIGALLLLVAYLLWLSTPPRR
jgi:hypothetical protein